MEDSGSLAFALELQFEVDYKYVPSNRAALLDLIYRNNCLVWFVDTVRFISQNDDLM